MMNQQLSDEYKKSLEDMMNAIASARWDKMQTDSQKRQYLKTIIRYRFPDLKSKDVDQVTNFIYIKYGDLFGNKANKNYKWQEEKIKTNKPDIDKITNIIISGVNNYEKEYDVFLDYIDIFEKEIQDVKWETDITPPLQIIRGIVIKYFKFLNKIHDSKDIDILSVMVYNKFKPIIDERKKNVKPRERKYVYNEEAIQDTSQYHQKGSGLGTQTMSMIYNILKARGIIEIRDKQLKDKVIAITSFIRNTEWTFSTGANNALLTELWSKYFPEVNDDEIVTLIEWTKNFFKNFFDESDDYDSFTDDDYDYYENKENYDWTDWDKNDWDEGDETEYDEGELYNIIINLLQNRREFTKRSINKFPGIEQTVSEIINYVQKVNEDVDNLGLNKVIWLIDTYINRQLEEYKKYDLNNGEINTIIRYVTNKFIFNKNI
jgi:hypothetical protein